jgi:hypothetical protein
MSTSRSRRAPLERPTPIRIVRELPLALEPVTPDPFIGVITPQRALVRESLLRVEHEKEPVCD